MFRGPSQLESHLGARFVSATALCRRDLRLFRFILRPPSSAERYLTCRMLKCIMMEGSVASAEPPKATTELVVAEMVPQAVQMTRQLRHASQSDNALGLCKCLPS